MSITAEEIREGLWTFPIVLPNNPLKWLNCYVIKGENGGRNLLIDTGFKQPECQQSLREGFDVIGIKPEDTDVFMTHLHSDHTGNAKMLEEMGCRMLMGRQEYHARQYDLDTKWSSMRPRMLAEGIESDIVGISFDKNPMIAFASKAFEAELLDEGDKICYGDYVLECVLTPGHTPAHMCLYEREKKIMFLGDHILFDITPNITAWAEVEDSLGTYLESLEKMRGFDVELALPAHRNLFGMTMYERIDQLIKHHDRRLAETEKIVRNNPGLNAFQITARLTWDIRARNWDEFPISQKFFAMGETLSHLDYLFIRGKIHRHTDAAGNITYTCAGE